MNEILLRNLKNAGADVEGTIRRFSGNTDLYEKFLLKFPADDNFEKIATACKTDDYELLFTAAHTLKGLSGNLGMTRLYKACSETVALIRAKDPEGAKNSFPELESAYKEMYDIISNEEGE